MLPLNRPTEVVMVVRGGGGGELFLSSHFTDGKTKAHKYFDKFHAASRLWPQHITCFSDSVTWTDGWEKVIPQRKPGCS